MKKKKQGFTLIELLVVVAIIALLISILLPSLSRARELAKRVKCGAQLNGLGKSCKIYANDFQEQWPTAPFSEQAVGTTGIRYAALGTALVGEGNGTLLRELPSLTDRDAGGTGTTQLSTTRSFWILVRSGEVTVNQFVCPSSSDTRDDTEEIERYYDFRTIANVSYGYQVPYGPRDSRPTENVDSRIGMIADKGPFWAGEPDNNFPGAFNSLFINSSPTQWTRLNSGNHGGRGAGEGQEVLFADGHTEFARKPIFGIDSDNLYTLMNDFASTTGRILGASPNTAGPTTSNSPYPGEGTFGVGIDASSDTLIYP